MSHSAALLQTSASRQKLELLFKKKDSLGETQQSQTETDLGRKQGIVKKFWEAKGYGFILDDAQQDYFVHFRDIAASGYRNLATGQNVSFQAFKGANGLFARDVRVVNI